MVINFDVKSINVIRGTSNSNIQLSSGNTYSVSNNSTIKLGRYYELSALADFIYKILRKYNTPQLLGEVRQNGMKYVNYLCNEKEFYEHMKGKALTSAQKYHLKGITGEYIHTDDLIAIMPKLVSGDEINLKEFELIVKPVIDRKRNEKEIVGQTITGIKVIEKERKIESDRVSSIPDYAIFDEYHNTTADTLGNNISNLSPNLIPQLSNMSIQAEPELINDDEYESKQQKYMEAALRAAEAASNYVKTKTEDIQEIYHNVKENIKRIIAKNPEKAKKIAQNTVFTIAVIATLITGAAKLSKGINKESQPETPPQQTAIADLSPYTETVDDFYNETEEIQEITLDDLKDNICLGENYYLEKGTPISSAFNEAPTGAVSNDTYIIDRIVLYDKVDQNKNILIDTVTKNPETGEIEFSEFYDKSISEIAEQNGLSNYGVSIHIAEKGHPCDNKYAKGWVLESNIKESFKELADKLQNELNKTGGKQL